MKQVVLSLLLLSQIVAFCYATCHTHQTCEACQTSPLCEWCVDDNLSNGRCQMATKDALSCPRRLRDTCDIKQLHFGTNTITMCEDLKDCGTCLESEWDCKFCPDQRRCVAAQSAESCGLPFITQTNELECPLSKHDAGSSLTPFACIIVLFSFLIMVL